MYNRSEEGIMEDIFNFAVDNEMYEKIVNGKKTIHIFIKNPKQAKLEAKNLITFSNKEDAEKDSIRECS